MGPNPLTFVLATLCFLALVNSSPLASKNTPSHRFVPLTRAFGSRATGHARYVQKRRALQGFQKRYGNGTEGTGNIQLSISTKSIEFLAPITFGNQTFNMIVDTGSSDTWAPVFNFTCFDFDGPKQTDPGDCGFQALYTPSTTFKQITTQHMNTSYGSGEYCSGPIGFEQVTFGGMTFTQEVGAIDVTNWRSGDNQSSGLMGLSTRFITSAQPGTDPSKDNFSNVINYNPLIFTMINQSLIPPMFSMAIDRGTTGGQLVLGSVPNVTTSGQLVAAPMVSTNGSIEEYQVVVDGFAIGGNDSPISSSAISASNTVSLVDSGTSTLSLPDRVFRSVIKAYSPAAKFNKEVDDFLVSCSATPPALGVKITGEMFTIDAKDMIVPSQAGDGLPSGLCFLGVDSNGHDGAILGDTFMTNAVVVFDLGATPQIKFQQRAPY